MYLNPSVYVVHNHGIQRHHWNVWIIAIPTCCIYLAPTYSFRIVLSKELLTIMESVSSRFVGQTILLSGRGTISRFYATRVHVIMCAWVIQVQQNGSKKYKTITNIFATYLGTKSKAIFKRKVPHHLPSLGRSFCLCWRHSLVTPEDWQFSKLNNNNIKCSMNRVKNK